MFPAFPGGCGLSKNSSTSSSSGTGTDRGGGTGSWGGSGTSGATTPLSASNVNLIFVVSEDSAYQAPGDINPTTANLTDQGLQRSLLSDEFLQNQVPGSTNVTAIYALEPVTHLQTANSYRDIAALGTIQQFTLLSQITLSTAVGSYSSPYAANSYPLDDSYASGSVPAGAATPSTFCSSSQGIDFNDLSGDNEALVTGIIKAGSPGFYVLSAPWETVSVPMAKVNTLEGYNLSIPAGYQGPDEIYAMAIPPSGRAASLITYNSGVQPSSTYPALPEPVATTRSCTLQSAFIIAVTGGSGGARIPAGSNTSETVYMIRHAEAHPEGLG